MKKRIIVVYSSHLGDDEDQKFNQHIDNTIGVKDYEILRYINHNQYSLPQIYNQALNEYDDGKSIFVFCHPDIKFETKNWGKNLLFKFNHTNYGILGVAGTTNISESGRWWEDQSKMVGIVNHESLGKKWESKYSNEFKKDIISTVLIDGLFMAVNPQVIERKFNMNFNGFHFYDISFCVDNYINGVNIGVLFDIRLTHKSIGKTNEQWEENRKLFIQQYSHHLPINIELDDIPDFLDKRIKLKEEPHVSIIIPTKNDIELICNVVDSFQEESNYNNYEIIIADTGSEENVLTETYNHMEQYDNIRIVEYDYYNFAKINNDVVKNHVKSDSNLLLFCNNDVEIMNDALSLVVDTYLKNRQNIGTIGARLHFEDNTVQHSGIFMYIQNKQLRLGHIGFKSYYTYFNKPTPTIGNTGAFMLVKKELFEEIGMFNEKYNECLEDVEFNLQCLLRGKINITVGNAIAYHYESLSRDRDVSKKNAGFQKDYAENLVPFVNKNINKLQNYIKIIE
ncbi:MAG: glycosyltransferase [Bacillota bacterium]